MAETKITKDIVLRNDVLRLIENMKTALTPDELGRLDSALLKRVTDMVSPAARRRVIDPSWVPEGAPFTMLDFEARVDKICGCGGRHDCNCVSVFNKAKVELWTEHNTKGCRAA